MNKWLDDGKCPFCLGQGWVPIHRPDDGENARCQECDGEGTSAAFWNHYRERMNQRADTVRNQGEI